MQFSQLAAFVPGQLLQLTMDRSIDTFLTDSRKVKLTDGACFFAMAGPRHDGHQYIDALYQSGVRQFVVEQTISVSRYPGASFFQTTSSLKALQQIATQHHAAFSYPVVGITGSNGKTIIKEWLFQLLSADTSVVKNPGSYNSQLGVPLSVLQMQPHHQLGIFEAGISRSGEMETLQRIMQPTLGIFANIGPAHDEGFANREEKIAEKLKLFSHADAVVFCADQQPIADAILQTSVKGKLGWGTDERAAIRVRRDGRDLAIQFHQREHHFRFPFTDSSSVENLTHCIVLLLHLGKATEFIQKGIEHLKMVPMRLEMKQGVNQCLLIDDSYNNDLAGLQIAIDFLSAQQKKKKTLILSDILQSGLPEESLIAHIKAIVTSASISRFIGVGPVLTRHRAEFGTAFQTDFFSSTDELLKHVSTDQFQREIVLLKGARPFQFEKMAQRLQRKIHGTVMEIDLNAMVNNLNYFKSKLQPGVKLMVMVKAFAYGSGSEEVANLLQYHQVDYLGVAYADEGVDLRKNHIALPIMVMNPTEESFSTLLEHKLEPEIYSIKLLKALINFLDGRMCRIHLKIDTGMHRLGFDNELDQALILLKSHRNIEVVSMFSHLAGADEAEHDAFSQAQVNNFTTKYQQLVEELQVKPLRHVLNSPGILRFPAFQFDMVRLGIGLYGVNPTEEEIGALKPVATLKTVISQIKKIPVGESIGYGRRGKATHSMTLATIAIGYADGFSRAFSRGVGFVMIHGKKAPVVGNVCMDMTMVDITEIPEALEGDEVIVFGKELPIQEVARQINTIAYEILTNTSERVKRVFYAESI